MLTQEQIDSIIRRVKGKHAVEAMVHDSPTSQVYELENGARLLISKETGHGWLVSNGERARRF